MEGVLTVAGRVETLGFFHQRFELSEFTQGLLGHSTVFNQNALSLLTHLGDIFRVSREIVQSMSCGHAGGVNRSKTEEQLTMGELVGIGLVLILSHAHHPLEHRVVTLGVAGGNVGSVFLDKGDYQLLCSLEVLVHAVPGWQKPD